MVEWLGHRGGCHKAVDKLLLEAADSLESSILKHILHENNNLDI